MIYRDVNVLLQIYSNAVNTSEEILARVVSHMNIGSASRFKKIELMCTHSSDNIDSANEFIMEDGKFPYRFTRAGYIIAPSSDKAFGDFITSGVSFPVATEEGCTRIEFYEYLKALLSNSTEHELLLREGLENKRYASDISNAKRLKLPLSKVSYDEIAFSYFDKKNPESSDKMALGNMVGAFESIKTDTGGSLHKSQGTDLSNTLSLSDLKVQERSTVTVPTGGKEVSSKMLGEKPVHMLKSSATTQTKESGGKPTVREATPNKGTKSTKVSDKKPTVKDGTSSKDTKSTKTTNSRVSSKGTSKATAETTPTSKENSETKPISPISAVTQEIGLGKPRRAPKKTAKPKGTSKDTEFKSGLLSALEHEEIEVVKSEGVELGGSDNSDVFKIVPSVPVEQEQPEVKGTAKKEVEYSRFTSVEYEPICPNIPFNREFHSQRSCYNGIMGLESLDDLDEAELLRCYPQFEKQIKYAFESMRTTDKMSLPKSSPRLVYVDDEEGLRFTEEERFLVCLANSPLLREFYKEFQTTYRVFETPCNVVYEKYNQLIVFCTPSLEGNMGYEDHELVKLKKLRWSSILSTGERWSSILSTEELRNLELYRCKVAGFYNRIRQFSKKSGFFLEGICHPRYIDINLFQFLSEDKALGLYKRNGYFWSKYFPELLTADSTDAYPPEVVKTFKVLKLGK